MPDNVFDLLWADRELPPETKDKLLNDLQTLKLVVDVVDLFTIKKAQVSGSIFVAIAKKQEDNKL